MKHSRAAYDRRQGERHGRPTRGAAVAVAGLCLLILVAGIGVVRIGGKKKIKNK